MTFSQGIRVVNCLSKRTVCNIWARNHGSVALRTVGAVNSVPSSLTVGVNVINISVKVKGVPLSACKINASRLFSSDSQDTFLKDERYRLKNDPEVKAWMNQIAQDFETGPIQLQQVQDEPSQHLSGRHTSDIKSDERVSTTPGHDSSDLELEVEDYGYIEDDEDDFADPVPERSFPVSLERGRFGVFDVEEIVAVLEDENGLDIQVIDVPPEAKFVNHMVVVSGKSLRHMRAMAASLEWFYKRKKKKSDRQFKLEGRDCKDWFAMDLGNIAVHIFTPDARQHYDIETLWTLGPEHDDQRHYVFDDSLNLSADDLFWLESGNSPSNDSASSPPPSSNTMLKSDCGDSNVTYLTDPNLKADSNSAGSLKNEKD